MTKFRTLSKASAASIVPALDAQAREARRRVGEAPGDFVGSSIAAQVPPAWDGTGAVPVGWAISLGVIGDDSGRLVLVCEGELAKDAQFDGAPDTLPVDWASAK